MITWFQRAFGKHNKWILMAFLVVLLVSFIISIGAVPRAALTGNRQTKNLFLGIDLNSQADMTHMERAVVFATQMSGGQIQNDQQLLLLRDQRIALKYTADQWHIPESTPKQVDDYMRALPYFRDADGNFSTERVVAFRDKLQVMPVDQRNEIIALLNENCRLDRAQQLIGGPGYRIPGVVVPTLMQIANAQDNFKYDLEAATFDRAKFEAKVDESEPALTTALTKLFEATPNRFQRPPQANLALVKFPSAPAPNPTVESLRTYLDKHKDKFPEITATPTPDDWNKVNEAWVAEQKDNALADAKTSAMKFAREVSDLNAALNTPAFAALLKKYNKAVLPLPTLTQGTPAPADSPVKDDDLQNVGFNLNPQNPMAPVPLPDGAGILFFVSGTPPRASTFAEARDDVLKAYREQEKARQFNARADELSAAITKAMADGKSFRVAAEAQELTVRSFSGVSDEELGNAAMEAFNPARDTPAVSPLASMGNDLIAALTEPDANHVPFLLTLQPGAVSKMVPGKDVGVIFHVVKREPAEIVVDTPEMRLRLDAVARQESIYSTAFSLQRLLQTSMAALKPNGS